MNKNGAITADDSARLNGLVRILHENRGIAAWLKSKKDNDLDLLVVLAEKLSGAEKSALEGVAQIVVPSSHELADRINTLYQENKRLRSLSLTDALTGLYNYRFFSKQLEIEMARTNRTGQPCTLMMIDLDNFKNLNDTLGHDEGNRFLVEAAQIAREKLRTTDSLCRFGGDEFAVIMPATSLGDAVQIAERLKAAICEIPQKQSVSVSASIGLAEFDPSVPWDMNEFIKKADKALYGAKKAGKNKVRYEGTLPGRLSVPAVTREEKTVLLKREQG